MIFVFVSLMCGFLGFNLGFTVLCYDKIWDVLFH